jgi:hypothetical protein
MITLQAMVNSALLADSYPSRFQLSRFDEASDHMDRTRISLS